MAFNLPVEIWLSICDYLPPISAAAFSISCKSVYHSLKGHSTQDLNEEDKLALLDLLATEDEIGCPYCLRLHSMSNAAKYSLRSVKERSQIQKLAPCVLSSFKSLSHRPAKVSGVIFKMAMKRHQLKPECDELLKILSRNSSTPEIDNSDGVSWQIRTDFKITRGLMIYRRQESVLFSNLMVDKDSWHVDIEVCAHLTIALNAERARLLDLGNKRLLNSFSEVLPLPFSQLPHHIQASQTPIPARPTCVRWQTIAGKANNNPDFNWPTHSTREPLKCDDCPTEYCLELDFNDSRGVFATVTTWANLGSGPHDWRYSMRNVEPHAAHERSLSRGKICYDSSHQSHWSAFQTEEDGETSLLSSEEDKERMYQAQVDGAMSSDEQVD
ncbi:uncharacterized protein EAF01_006201 [Botrytis porri]|uniref:F-box domain-containing protein n=1 Tax=Botrytis porri TaxID=87229 RepID=A0A4Z1KAT6_9HELO|nr:uncharacterized protein EAF01_006201 [Botrytis porri]KAF7903152.1 hypothetical protein EAF01_006201 [Botrytis porri]TGO81280.1 hypothetical protein BPOR_1228g00020 [Botrytis porri]